MWKSTLASGILSLIFGIVVLAWPVLSIPIAAVAFGIYLVMSIFGGVATTVSAISVPTCRTRVVDLRRGDKPDRRHCGDGIAVRVDHHLAIVVGI